MAEHKYQVGDKVKVLDGTNILDYYGGFVASMMTLIGETFTVHRLIVGDPERPAYVLSDDDNLDLGYAFDERGLEKVGVYKLDNVELFDFLEG